MPFSAFNELRRRSFARDTKAPTFGFELEGDPFRVPARVPATCDKAPHFAGPLARRVSSIGILCFGSLLAAIGLYGLCVFGKPAEPWYKSEQ